MSAREKRPALAAKMTPHERRIVRAASTSLLAISGAMLIAHVAGGVHLDAELLTVVTLGALVGASGLVAMARAGLRH